MIHLSPSLGMGTEHEPPTEAPEVWTTAIREDGVQEWTNAKGEKRYAPPGKKVVITKGWWDEIKKMPDFEEVMKRKGLTEDEVYVLAPLPRGPWYKLRARLARWIAPSPKRPTARN